MEIANLKGAEEELTSEDTKKMKYSWNLICEVLRMEPPNSGTFREIFDNCNHGGAWIVVGTKI